ncbi:hypothetical protein WI36_11190 [Burkholderia ubonensis]|nr:hypothetical protein WI36_11190 [Burkholderia ubonensis]
MRDARHATRQELGGFADCWIAKKVADSDIRFELFHDAPMQLHECLGTAPEIEEIRIDRNVRHI